MSSSQPRIAVLLPCYDEGPAIGPVVAGFRKALPRADVYVYDNNSKDDTAARAQAAGAIVRRESRQGKGSVVRRMFADIDADVYVLADGDGTYDPEDAPRLVSALMRDRLDMITGIRSLTDASAYRQGHRFGNRLLTGAVNVLFGERNRDMLSGYRAFSQRFVKSFPALSDGFEIETEFAVHASELRVPTGEIEVRYLPRAAGTASKLRTWRDGVRIVIIIAALLKNERPFQASLAVSAAFAALGLAAGVPIILEFARTGLVTRLPTAILATGLMVLSALALLSGIIADAVARAKREMRRLHYLSLPRPPEPPSAKPAGRR